MVQFLGICNVFFDLNPKGYSMQVDLWHGIEADKESLQAIKTQAADVFDAQVPAEYITSHREFFASL